MDNESENTLYPAEYQKLTFEMYFESAHSSALRGYISEA